MGDKKIGLEEIFQQAGKASASASTLGVIVVSPKDPHQLISKYGEDGLEELFEEVISILRNNVRAVDLITRIDEFTIGVVSVDRNPKGPKRFGEKIANLIEKAEYTRMGLPVQAEFVVGASWGVPSDSDTVKSLIQKAKAAVQKARENNLVYATQE